MRVSLEGHFTMRLRVDARQREERFGVAHLIAIGFAGLPRSLHSAARRAINRREERNRAAPVGMTEKANTRRRRKAAPTPEIIAWGIFFPGLGSRCRCRLLRCGRRLLACRSRARS